MRNKKAPPARGALSTAHNSHVRATITDAARNTQRRHVNAHSLLSQLDYIPETAPAGTRHTVADYVAPLLAVYGTPQDQRLARARMRMLGFKPPRSARRAGRKIPRRTLARRRSAHRLRSRRARRHRTSGCGSGDGDVSDPSRNSAGW